MKLCFDGEAVEKAEKNITQAIAKNNLKAITAANVKQIVAQIKEATKKEATTATAEKTLRKHIMQALLLGSKTLTSVEDIVKKYALQRIILSQHEAEEILKKYFKDYNIKEILSEASKETVLKLLIQHLGEGLESVSRKTKTTGDAD